jgi:hypothetical protein
MDSPISVPFFACFWCQVSVFRCQFAGFSFLKPDTRLRGRSRYGAAKARNLKPHLLSNAT